MVAHASEEAAPVEAIDALLKTYCIRCHDAEKHKGGVNLTAIGPRPETIQGRKVWRRVLEQLESEEMPPEEPLPDESIRRRLIEWASRGLASAASSARDPGRVIIPRLTREEYNHTMRDLLGIDLRPGDAFSADGEGDSGFNTDRGSLFLTPALMEKYLAAADSALDACIALEQEPVGHHFESEAMFMTETREVPRDFGDGFKGYVLNRGQMTLYDSFRFPQDGFYTFTVRARSAGAPCRARLRVDGESKGDIVAPSSDPVTLAITCFVKQGSWQMTWNIEAPGPPMPAAEQDEGLEPRSAPQAIGPNSREANALVNTRSQQNAPTYPVVGDESREVLGLVRRLDAAALSVQRPHEWLRLLGPEGDPTEIARFKGYILERGKNLEAAKRALAEALGQTSEEIDGRYEQHNRERLTDNRRLVEAVASIPARVVESSPRRPGPAPRPAPKAKVPPVRRTIAIDWIEVRGPIHPDGPGHRSRVFTARPGPDLSPREAARQILVAFLPRAFRRPVDDDQIERYLQLFDRAERNGDSFERGVKLALSAVLVSPHFLYRDEFGPNEGEFRLDDYQLASRLSYFLWMSMPDDELYALAKEGRLHEPDVLSAQVDRLLADPRSRAFVSAFMGQWLGFEALGVFVQPDPNRFPGFTPELCEAMKQETVLAFESLLRENGRLSELLDSRETWLNETLARHYGIGGVRGATMRRVRIDDPNRGGLLGMASILTVTSSPTRTSPVVRGRWVLETLLGETIPEPPADAGSLDPEAGEDRGRTLREELLLHRRNPSCASCHDRIDPIGFGLENFDAIGRFRTLEAGRPIDNVGELPGGEAFRGAAELKEMLVSRHRSEFVRNITERLLCFALGRKLELADEPTLLEIIRALDADGDRAATLIKLIVGSYPFQYQNTRGRLE